MFFFLPFKIQLKQNRTEPNRAQNGTKIEKKEIAANERTSNRQSNQRLMCIRRACFSTCIFWHFICALCFSSALLLLLLLLAEQTRKQTAKRKEEEKTNEKFKRVIKMET